MSDYWIAFIAGIVEGLTEFLPVSSTAHLVITQRLLGIDLSQPFWKMFTVVIQLGAILAVILYFRKRLYEFCVSFWREIRPSPSSEPAISATSAGIPRVWWNHPLMLVLISFVITAIPCFLMDRWIAERLETPDVIAWALILGGIAMVAIDWLCTPRARTMRMDDISMKQAIVIGAAQILSATFPGTSRSMSTIAGGQLMGLSRPAALEFSFFLSIPVMFAAAGFKLLQYVLSGPVAMSSSDWITLTIGFMTSLVVAWGVIAWFMHWVRRRGFVPFAIYRIALGIAVLVWMNS